MGNIQKQNILKSLSDAGKSFMNIGKQFLKQFSLKTCEKTQFRYDSFSDKVAHEVTQCEKNPNLYFWGTSLPYS